MEQRPVVSLEETFSLWKARSVKCRQCPTRMLRVVWEGCCERILTKGSFAFRYRALQAQDISLDSKEFFWMQGRR